MKVSKKTVKPSVKKKTTDEFVPIVLEPETEPEVKTFHAFTIGETEYHGLSSVPFGRARELYGMLTTATSDKPVDLDQLVCVEVYGEEGWNAMVSFDGIQRDDYMKLVAKASDIVLGTLGKAR